MLALYTGRGVTLEVNLRECISHTPPQSSSKAEPTLALKPRGDITRSSKQVYQWPHKWTCVQQKPLKKIGASVSETTIWSINDNSKFLNTEMTWITFIISDVFKFKLHRLLYLIAPKTGVSLLFKKDRYKLDSSG